MVSLCFVFKIFFLKSCSSGAYYAKPFYLFTNITHVFCYKISAFHSKGIFSNVLTLKIDSKIESEDKQGLV